MTWRDIARPIIAEVIARVGTDVMGIVSQDAELVKQ